MARISRFEKIYNAILGEAKKADVGTEVELDYLHFKTITPKDGSAYQLAVLIDTNGDTWYTTNRACVEHLEIIEELFQGAHIEGRVCVSFVERISNGKKYLDCDFNFNQ